MAPVEDPAAITVALVDDYDVVLIGVAHMFDRYRDRIVVAEIDANAALHDEVDIVLYDSFAQPESDHEEIGVLVRNPSARRVVVYTGTSTPTSSRARGGRGRTATCPRRCRPAIWWQPWKRCTPARS